MVKRIVNKGLEKELVRRGLEDYCLEKDSEYGIYIQGKTDELDDKIIDAAAEDLENCCYVQNFGSRTIFEWADEIEEFDKKLKSLDI